MPPRVSTQATITELGATSPSPTPSTEQQAGSLTAYSSDAEVAGPAEVSHINDNKGFGLFVTRDVPEGELILNEKPILKVFSDSQSQTLDVVRTWLSWFVGQQAAYSELCGAATSDLSAEVD